LICSTYARLSSESNGLARVNVAVRASSNKMLRGVELLRTADCLCERAIPF